MKIIRYQLATRCNVGTAEEPKWEDVLSESTMPYSEENLEMVKALSCNGVFTVEDDGNPVPEQEPAADAVLDVLLGVM